MKEKRGRAKPRKRIGTTTLAPMDRHGNWKRPPVQRDIADADKLARTGSKQETVRDTPPAGAWNDVSDD
ncbi:MAG TPA: hypothetical protein VKQ31_05935 [Steroidobacteraceae bacterium]|nr:hypothetical protein [Steroidobacteraceae bacterium]